MYRVAIQVHSPIFFKTNSLQSSCKSLDSREDQIKKNKKSFKLLFCKSKKCQCVKNWIASLDKKMKGGGCLGLKCRKTFAYDLPYKLTHTFRSPRHVLCTFKLLVFNHWIRVLYIQEKSGKVRIKRNDLLPQTLIFQSLCIFAIGWRKTILFQSINPVRSNRFSLKYQVAKIWG